MQTILFSSLRFCPLLAIFVIFAQLFGSEVMAQNYPNRPVRIVVGSSPGGAADFEARLFAQELTKLWSQPVIVENRVGASQTIAANIVAKSQANGYNMVLLTNTILAAGLNADLPYNLERDLTPLVLVATGPLVLVVNPAVPVQSVKELIAMARSQPGKLNFGAAEPGSTNHLAGELFNMSAKVNIVYVPFKGATEANVAAMSGEVQIAYPGVVGTSTLVDSGRLRALAVTSKERSSAMPSVPTMDEAGLPGYEFVNWHGMWTTAGVSKNIFAQLRADLVKVGNSPQFKEKLRALGLDPQNYTQEQFAAKIHSDLVQYLMLAKTLGLK